MSALFKNFEEQSKKDWLIKVEKDLKGKPLQSLDWQLSNHFNFSPFAHQEDLDGKPSLISNNKTTNSWEIGTLITVVDFKLSNGQAISYLNNGANAICFQLSHTPKKEELSQLLADIQLEWISTHFIVQQESWKMLTERFVEIIKEKGQDPSKVICSFDVIGSPVSEEKEIGHLKSIQLDLPKGRFLSINTLDLFSDKEKMDQAIAKTIKQGNDILIKLSEEEFDLAKYSKSIQFNISLTDSYFLNIASIRALRMLWQQCVHAWNSDLSADAPIIVHLNESTHVEDENYNKIKAGAQAMAAVIGGADCLYIYPSDSNKKEGGTAFSQRIALNIQHLLVLESYFDRVIDPSAGSYYIEELTNQLAESAWKQFQDSI
ncbi:MAG: methylmalonyl-CoA mutase family protein [Saprospiraceae bacterium]